MYRDRGIMKWAPFDALSGFSSLISELKYNRGKVGKPEFTQDILDEFSYKLNEALSLNIEVELEYFIDGYFKKITGFIKEVDMISKTIIFENKIKIRMELVTNIFI